MTLAAATSGGAASDRDVWEAAPREHILINYEYMRISVMCGVRVHTGAGASRVRDVTAAHATHAASAAREPRHALLYHIL